MEGILAAISGRRGDDSLAEAQDVMYQAWEQTNPRMRIALARKALEISALCADAYTLLAEQTKSLDEARDLYGLAVEAAELALGPAAFEEYAGHFWGFLETRPYMRARAGLASTLLTLGDEDAAISHYRDMLKLNPDDNQGIRYCLAACLLRRDEEAALQELLAAYPDEVSTNWLYTRALLAFRAGGADDKLAVDLAKDAWAGNEHVPAILAGTEQPVCDDSGYLTVGGPDEATFYVTEFGPGWFRTPGAVDWLSKIAASLPPKRRTKPGVH